VASLGDLIRDYVAAGRPVVVKDILRVCPGTPAWRFRCVASLNQMGRGRVFPGGGGEKVRGVCGGCVTAVRVVSRLAELVAVRTRSLARAPDVSALWEREALLASELGQLNASAFRVPYGEDGEVRMVVVYLCDPFARMPLACAPSRGWLADNRPYYGASRACVHAYVHPRRWHACPLHQANSAAPTMSMAEFAARYMGHFNLTDSSDPRYVFQHYQQSHPVLSEGIGRMSMAPISRVLNCLPQELQDYLHLPPAGMPGAWTQWTIGMGGSGSGAPFHMHDVAVNIVLKASATWQGGAQTRARSLARLQLFSGMWAGCGQNWCRVFRSCVDRVDSLNQGTKRWFVYPPTYATYSTEPIFEFLRDVYPTLPPHLKPIEFMQEPGDLVLLPACVRAFVRAWPWKPVGLSLRRLVRLQSRVTSSVDGACIVLQLCASSCLRGRGLERFCSCWPSGDGVYKELLCEIAALSTL
jgi:hypothetical protein